MRKQIFLQTLTSIFIISVVLGFSFFSERMAVEKQLKSYVGLWEEETTRALILNQDPVLLQKILTQVKLFQPVVELTEVSLSNQGPPHSIRRELDQFEIPLTLNMLPVGTIKIQLSISRLIIESALSPVFLTGFLLAIGFFFFLWSREFRARMEKARLDQETRSQREIATIARQVAHDIRSPLTALITVKSKIVFEDLALRTLLDHSCERIQAIAEDLLAKSRAFVQEKELKLAQLETDTENSIALSRPPAMEPIDLAQIVDILRSEFQIKYPNIEWAFVSRLGKPVFISLGQIKLTRILANLLQNSAEAIVAKGGRVNMEIFERNQRLTIQIQDNGIGIPEELISQVLEEGKSFGKRDGNGLGLSDSKKTIEEHLGRLRLHSKKGIGTLVEIELPISLSILQ